MVDASCGKQENFKFSTLKDEFLRHLREFTGFVKPLYFSTVVGIAGEKMREWGK